MCWSTRTHLLHQQRLFQAKPQSSMGTKRQCQTPSGALTPHASSLVGPDSGRKRGLFGSPHGTARLGRNLHKPLARSSRVLVQNGAEQNDESRTVPDTQQVSQTQPLPIRVKAAPSHLRQTPPSSEKNNHQRRTILMEQRPKRSPHSAAPARVVIQQP